jgi:phospholipase/carboxylesterase
MSLLIIFFLTISAGSGSPSQMVAESTPPTNNADVKIEEPEQEVVVESMQTKTPDNSSEVMPENVEVANVTLSPLPQRLGARPTTTGAVPHQQIGVEPVPDINASLHRWIASLPDVEMQNSIASLPGATGIWLKEGTAIAQPQVILAGREFSHIHTDGSLHTPLPFARAMEAVEMGWAEPHPWAEQRAGWEGLVMLYTPQSEADLEIVFQLVVESYNFVTGQTEVAANNIN